MEMMVSKQRLADNFGSKHHDISGGHERENAKMRIETFDDASEVASCSKLIKDNQSPESVLWFFHN